MKTSDPWRLPDARGFVAGCGRALAASFAPVLAACGVRRDTLRTLLGLHYAVDQRRAGESHLGWVQALIGVGALKSGLGVFLVAWMLKDFHGPDLLYPLCFAQTFAICGLMLLNFHADALVDGDDLRVVGATPVPARTVYAARAIFMGSHAALLAILCALWPMALGALVTGDAWPLLLVPFIVFCAWAAATGGVALAHSLLLGLVGARRYASAALALRVALVGVGLAASQLLPRETRLLEELWRHPLRPWVPPASFEGLGPLLRGEGSATQLQAASLSIAACLLLLPLAVLATSRRYLRALQDQPLAKSSAQRGLEERGWLAWLGDRLCRDSAERAGYGYASALARREKPFLRQSLVMAAGIVAGSVLAFVGMRRGQTQVLGDSVLAGIAFTAVVGSGVFDVARFSATPMARWIFAAAPRADLVAIHRGALLGVLASFWLPLQATILLLCCLLLEPAQWLHVLAAMVCATAVMLLWIDRFRFHLPFTEPFAWQDASMRNLVPALSMLGATLAATVALGFAYWFLPWSPWAALALGGAGCLAGWRRLRAAPGPLAASRAPAASPRTPAADAARAQ